MFFNLVGTELSRGRKFRVANTGSRLLLKRYMTATYTRILDFLCIRDRQRGPCRLRIGVVRRPNRSENERWSEDIRRKSSRLQLALLLVFAAERRTICVLRLWQHHLPKHRWANCDD